MSVSPGFAAACHGARAAEMQPAAVCTGAWLDTFSIFDFSVVVQTPIAYRLADFPMVSDVACHGSPVRLKWPRSEQYAYQPGELKGLVDIDGLVQEASWITTSSRDVSAELAGKGNLAPGNEGGDWFDDRP